MNEQQQKVLSLIRLWDREGAVYRDDLRRMARQAGCMTIDDGGHRVPDVAGYIATIFKNGRPSASLDPRDAAIDEPITGIYELANAMLDDGYEGQGLDEPDKARDYIYMAADNPDVESELPEAGIRFWKACKFQYRLWKSKKKRGVA